MVRNLENSMSNNSNIQDVGPRRSTRLNMALGEMAPLPRGSTMGTTAARSMVPPLSSLSSSSPTTARNLRAKIWRSSSKSKTSSSTCPCQDILKATGRSKHPTRRSSTASRNPSPTRRENGQKNSPDVYKHIAPPRGEQPEKPLSLWRLAQKQSFLPTSSCQASPPYC